MHHQAQPASKLIDVFDIRTEFQVILVGPDGLRIMNLGPNVITNSGRSNMAHLFAGHDVANRSALSIKVGDAGHNPLSPSEPVVANSSDTALFGSVVITKSLSFEFPDGENANRVTFTATIGTNEANGSGSQAISEVGIFDLAGRMLSHKTFGLITKTEIFGLQFRYSFLF